MENQEQQPNPEQEKWNALADKIEELDPSDHLGPKENRYLTITEYIAEALRAGDIELAKNDCQNQSDKFGSREEVKKLLIKELFDGGDNPWELSGFWDKE